MVSMGADPKLVPVMSFPFQKTHFYVKENREMTLFMIRLGADCNKKDRMNKNITVLHLALEGFFSSPQEEKIEREKIVTALLESGADPNFLSNGLSPIDSFLFSMHQKLEKNSPTKIAIEIETRILLLAMKQGADILNVRHLYSDISKILQPFLRLSDSQSVKGIIKFAVRNSCFGRVNSCSLAPLILPNTNPKKKRKSFQWSTWDTKNMTLT